MEVDLVSRVAQLLSDISEQPVRAATDDRTAGEMAGALALLTGAALIKRREYDRAADCFSTVREIADQELRGKLADQWLLLAKTWGKQSQDQEQVAKVERALDRAVEFAPTRALPALAQFLQRQERLTDALSRWRDAIRLSPQDGQSYLNLARLYERLEEPEKALATYVELIEAAPSAKNYLVAAQRVEDLAGALPSARPAQQIKIGVVGNATLDHLRSYLHVECVRAGLRPEFYQGGFDQYTQEILNPASGLYAFAPDVLICAIHPSRLFPQLHDWPFDLSVEQRRTELEAGLNTIQSLLTAFTDRSPALVLFLNMVTPQHPAIGVADLRDELGQTRIFGEINTRLAEMVRSRYRNVYLVDEDRVQARAGKARATDPRLWLTARMGWSDAVLPGLAREYLRYLTPYKAMGRKCIVLDLDNTLWGGVVGEDGVAGIQLGADAPGNAYTAFQHELERLWRRGILLAISSKNNLEDALAVFEQHPAMVLKLSHFAAYRINWDSKADNLRELAKELNIGLDSLVFLDDNPVERAKVRAELPQVLTPELPTDPAQYRNALLDLTVFDSLGLTDEDRVRNKLYADQKARQTFEAEQKSSGSVDDFLANLEMVVEIAPANALTLPRVAQLTNKTNQFNLTTRRYSEAQILEMQAKGSRVYSMRVSDRFGDNGVVGVAIVTPVAGETWELDTLLLSCRVMGRGVETALLAFVVDQARAAERQRLQGWYIPTAKNAPVKDCYHQHGFTLVEQRPDGAELWTLDVAEAAITPPGWLSVRIAQ